MFPSTFRRLEVFVTVVESGGFIAGAERLGISHPSVTLVSRVFDGTALPMVTTIALCALAAFALSWFTLHPAKMIVKPAK
jgi:Bacterial regulatory helix-turn-helix protein, lysR family